MAKPGWKIETQTRVGASPRYRWIYWNGRGNEWMGPPVATPSAARIDFAEWWQFSSAVPKKIKSKLPPESA